MNRLWAGIGVVAIVAGASVFAVMPWTKHVSVSRYEVAEWNNLRGTLITQTILQAPAYAPYVHGAVNDAIYIALPGPPYGSDAAVFLPQPLVRQWIKMYEGTTFVPPEAWAKKLGVKLTLKSMDITTDWTGLKVQVGVQADSSV